jgi:hypothetical protein
LTRKLLLLNLVLLVAVGAAGWRLRQDWLAARAREQALLHRQVTPPPPPPVIFSKPAEPVSAAAYADIAQKMLFSKDRNPTVVVEVKAAPAKPMPPLPLLYGVMNLPDGATAVMSEKVGSRHRGVRPGEKVGEFTLLAVSREDITLEWDGKQMVKKIDELLDRAGPPEAAPDGATPRATAQAAPSSTQLSSQSPPGKPEPGQQMNDRMRACQPNDPSPAGTVAGGFRKLVTPTPFGSQCRWEPI